VAVRVKMDWLLFWTVLGLTSLGLVMVYSSSSLYAELKRKERVEEGGRPPTAAGPADAVLVPAGNPPTKPGRAPWSRRRYAAAAVGVAALAFLAHRYATGSIPLAWLAAGAAAVCALQVLAYWMDADRTPHYSFLLRQSGAAIVGFLALMFFSQRDYRTWQSARWAFGGLGVVIFLLGVAYRVDKYFHRWIDIGVSIQPSEFAKPALIVFLAWFVTKRSGAINHPHTILPAALALIMLAGGVVVGDFGMTVVLVVTTAAVFYMAGLNRRYILAALGIGSLLLAVAIVAVPYRLLRVLTYVDPKCETICQYERGRMIWEYAESGSRVKDGAYQTIQSTIAIGAGGVMGRGLMQSRQKLLFLPEAHTDFIFAIVAEELGLWGATLVLAGFVIIMWRGYRLYLTAGDEFGRYLAVGATTTLVFQALLNMSVVLDLGPTKGIPLPLISFGGGSMVSTMICLGLLLSVGQRAAHSWTSAR